MSNSIVHAMDKNGKVVNIAEQLIKRAGEFADVIHDVSRAAIRSKEHVESPADIVCEVVGLGSGLATVLDHHCRALVSADVLTQANSDYIRAQLFDVIGHLQLEAVARIHGREVSPERLTKPIAEGASLGLDGSVLDGSDWDTDTGPVDKSQLN